MSDDALNSQLQKAAAFMAEVRGAQLASGRSLSGPSRLTPDQQYAITEISKHSSLVGAVKETLRSDLPVNAMFERFEEMCRRREFPITPILRPGILKLLAAELWANTECLRARPKDLIAVTVYHGNIAALAGEEEFAALRDTPGIFKYAAVNNASNPRAFLRNVQKNIAALAGEEEFAALRDAPGIFKHAAVHNPSDPRAFLRNVQKDIAALAGEEEFAGLRSGDSPDSATLRVFYRPYVNSSRRMSRPAIAEMRSRSAA